MRGDSYGQKTTKSNRMLWGFGDDGNYGARCKEIRFSAGGLRERRECFMQPMLVQDIMRLLSLDNIGLVYRLLGHKEQYRQDLLRCLGLIETK